MAKITTRGAKITIHFMIPVNKKVMSAGLDATSILVSMLVTTAKNMLL
jgi:hypothetical protein